MTRKRFSYIARPHQVVMVDNPFNVGDIVQIDLSNALIKIEEVFALNYDEHYRNSEGLHIRGTVIHDGSYYNTDKGARSHSIPVRNIVNSVDINYMNKIGYKFGNVNL